MTRKTTSSNGARADGVRIGDLIYDQTGTVRCRVVRPIGRQRRVQDGMVRITFVALSMRGALRPSTRATIDVPADSIVYWAGQA